jgi:hypothetical protein
VGPLAWPVGLGPVRILDGLEVTIVGTLGERLTEPDSGIHLTRTTPAPRPPGTRWAPCSAPRSFGYLTDRFGRNELCMLSAPEGDPIGIRQRRATSFMEITLTELVLGADAERRPLETSRAAPRPGRPDFSGGRTDRGPAPDRPRELGRSASLVPRTGGRSDSGE